MMQLYNSIINSFCLLLGPRIVVSNIVHWTRFVYFNSNDDGDSRAVWLALLLYFYTIHYYCESLLAIKITELRNCQYTNECAHIVYVCASSHLNVTFSYTLGISRMPSLKTPL